MVQGLMVQQPAGLCANAFHAASAEGAPHCMTLHSRCHPAPCRGPKDEAASHHPLFINTLKVTLS